MSVYGLGYIGLPTAAMLARSGLTVTGVDIDPDIVALVNAGKPQHTDEAGLGALVAEACGSGRLRASTLPVPADVHIVAVGTPVKPDRSPDLSAVEAVVRSLTRVLRPGDLVVVESTVPPMTCEGLVASVIVQATGLDHRHDYKLAHCPERVIPGDLLRELVMNDRIVGGTTPAATEAAAALYRRFVTGAVIETDARTAETCKLLENTYRDVNIALANELAALTASVGVDPDKAFSLANRHPRVNLHRPGIGVGGHCIPVDPWFLVAIDPARAPLLRIARDVNDSLPARVAAGVRSRLGNLDRVTLLGLSYKPDVDDMRESPSLEVASLLAADGRLQVDIVEPHVASLPARLAALPNVRLVTSDVAVESDGLTVLLTAHNAFAPLLNELPSVVDARELLYEDSGTVEPLTAARTRSIRETPGTNVSASRSEELPAGRN